MRSPQPRSGEGAAEQGRLRRSRHACLEARSTARRAPAHRRPAHVAEGRTGRDDLRLRVARRASRRRRAPARRVVGLRRRGRTDDGVGRSAQHAGRHAPRSSPSRAMSSCAPISDRSSRACSRRCRATPRSPPQHSEDDMYLPVAAQLGVDRATAKVAVLGAMYGQTTGHGARALRGLDSAYPVAMAYLQEADRSGQLGRALRTYGGRLIPMGDQREHSRRRSRLARPAPRPRVATGATRWCRVRRPSSSRRGR